MHVVALLGQTPLVGRLSVGFLAGEDDRVGGLRAAPAVVHRRIRRRLLAPFIHRAESLDSNIRCLANILVAGLGSHSVQTWMLPSVRKLRQIFVCCVQKLVLVRKARHKLRSFMIIV